VPLALFCIVPQLSGAAAETRNGCPMSDPKNDQPDPLASPSPDDEVPSDGTARRGPDNDLDIEADALLDSLLAEEEQGAHPDPAGESERVEAKSSFSEEEEVTGIIVPRSTRASAPDTLDEFADADDLLISDSSPPARPPAAEPPAKTAKGTLLGMRAARPPRPEGV